VEYPLEEIAEHMEFFLMTRTTGSPPSMTPMFSATVLLKSPFFRAAGQGVNNKSLAGQLAYTDPTVVGILLSVLLSIKAQNSFF
jgi:hypothetical protein